LRSGASLRIPWAFLFRRSFVEMSLPSTLCLGAESMQSAIPRLISAETSTVDGLLGWHSGNKPETGRCLFGQLFRKFLV
jgi:hypothetical protein